jgi:uroporphyrinogen III methyltransferase / synthase
MAKGTVYLVGAGPGDAGLLTLRGKDLLARADVVVYDHLASPRLLGFAPDSAQRIYVGKQAAKHAMSQEQINHLLVDLANEGKTVVRLKGGDPFVFGRGGEEALALVEASVPFEVVPGVTSGIAAAAYAGIPVTHRDMASCLGLVTGHEDPDKEESALDYATLARWGGTLAFYMGVSNLAHICRQLIAHGLDKDTPAAVIRWGATPRQQVVAGTLGTLDEEARKAGLTPPAMIVVGQVVRLREKLNWYERRPLFGKTVIVTRARAQASQLAAGLEELGAQVIELPAISVEKAADAAPLRRAVEGIESFDFVIFTSVNGVEAFFDHLQQAGKDARSLHNARIVAIGPATAERLGQFGIRADIQPAQFVSTAIVETMLAKGELKGKRILCPRADIAPKELVQALEAHGAQVVDVAAYRTVAEDADPELTGQARQLFTEGKVNWVTFTSSSTVRHFFALIDGQLVGKSGAKLASIGPSTSHVLRELGLAPTVEARTFTIPGLMDAIIQAESAGGKTDAGGEAE